VIHFVSDAHFSHCNIIRYCKRPFASVEEMDEALIANWNNKVSNDDIVYHIGDFCFGKPEYYLSKLNGEKHLLLGDHDKQIQGNLKGLAIVHREMILKLSLKIENENVQIILCHWCMRVWPKSHYNTWHLFGHSHGGLKPRGKSWDVGVDNNNFTPLSLNDINTIMQTRPANFNCLRNLPGYNQQEFDFYKDHDEEDV
jgi:calcineurin-like phosphoesterase family protein